MTDLQNAILALQAEDSVLLSAIAAAVTELQNLEAQVAAIQAGDPTDTAALEALATSVSAVTSSLTTAVSQLAAAAPVSGS